MSRIKALEKLREWLDETEIVIDENDVGVLYLSRAERDMLRDLPAEFEVEITERYQLLPVDADGVPIRVGDLMEMKMASTEVVGIGPDYYITGKRVGDAQLRCDGWNFATSSRHVKPRTLEDVRDKGRARDIWNRRGLPEVRLVEVLRCIADEMRGFGASTMTPHELLDYFAGEVDRAADMAGRLRSTREADDD